MDSVASIADLQRIGTAVAAQKVDRGHLNFEVFKP
jgi:hypothetical protein